MARVPMVTRTFTTTKATCLCLNIITGEPYNEVFTLPRVYKDEKALLKKITSSYDNEEHKAVHVVSTETIETLYGMPEEEFIANARILPAREVETANTAEG